ncbi:hypothetical protein GQ600_20183 [Phytophthora cactorum]|nr:hypothetical protein GQ600_20183 [Phytophthora cactorum]
MLRDLDVTILLWTMYPPSGSAEQLAFELLAATLSSSDSVVISLQWRGNARVIRAEDAPPLLQLIERCGKETAWRMALHLFFFFYTAIYARAHDRIRSKQDVRH